MSEHILRQALIHIASVSTRKKATEALDALVAENQQLRDEAKALRDDVATYRANGTIVTDETLRGWERRLTRVAFPYA